MANSESQFHKEYRDAIKKSYKKQKTFKISDQFIAGILDIYSQTPETGAVWTELKFERAPKLETTPVRVKMSDNQRSFIKTTHEAGGLAGWCLCVKHKNFWRYYAGADPKTLILNQLTFLTERRIGGDLDVVTLLNTIIKESIDLH